MKINDIFKIPVYETQLGLDVEKMKRYCLLHEIDNETRELSNAGGYQSNNLNGEFPDLNDLFVELFISTKPIKFRRPSILRLL